MRKEYEIRKSVKKEYYGNILDYLNKKYGEPVINEQVTIYYPGEQDIRIQRNGKTSKIWYKSGEIHDNLREEIEVWFDSNYLFKLHKIVCILINCKSYEIGWIRKRREYRDGDIVISLDDTEGYGVILEAEILADNIIVSEAEYKITGFFKSIPKEWFKKEDFEKKLDLYRKNWENLIGRRKIDALLGFL